MVEGRVLFWVDVVGVQSVAFFVVVVDIVVFVGGTEDDADPKNDLGFPVSGVAAIAELWWLLLLLFLEEWMDDG